ncbi:unnamed protein product [Cyclocybe aegerita]|uniref:Septin-type G domain-containing protein n=1 Tax=Cyclocybe aegerita TaxID=1973307 RepID=A0A8S0XYB6_CYCAE|nr:unnamed protein product [Cyclocybe aegerita]
MEDTATLSTSASSVRTLHQSLAELASQREQQLGSSGVTDCAASTSTSHASSSTNTGVHVSESYSAYSGSSSGLVLPSPPDSPNLSPIHSATHSPSIDSVSESSLPSVSSSFFFSSSAAGSPGRSRASSYPHSEGGSQPHSDHESKPGHNLIIPSLTLPSALRRPTPFGQTLGELRLLVLGAQGAGKSFLTGLLLEDNEDVVEVGTWEDWEEGSGDGDGYGKVLRASTDWAEQKDSFGLERFEPTRNVHIVELPGYGQDADVSLGMFSPHPPYLPLPSRFLANLTDDEIIVQATELITRLKHIIETPFHALNNVLHPDTAPSGIVASMLASPTSPLYTALVFLLPSTPTTLDRQIISALSTHIPLIVLPRLHGPHREAPDPSKLSNFRPSSAVALRNGLFHSPETVQLLRSEAVDRFLRWREVERSVEQIASRETRKRRLGEREWGRSKNHSLDVHVARREREGTVTKRSASHPKAALESSDHMSEKEEHDTTSPRQPRQPYWHPQHPDFDPLHLPSLLIFGVSLLGPLKERLSQSVRGLFVALGEARVRVALVGGFCIGVGFSVFTR